jgi:hypothetical protein
MPALPDPTRLIEPGTRTPPRLVATSDGLLDVRIFPLEPAPSKPRLYAIVAVGTETGTEFQARELSAPPPFTALRGTVLLTVAAANPPGARTILVGVGVYLAGSGGIEPVALWSALDAAWPEIVRTSVVFAARHHCQAARHAK